MKSKRVITILAVPLLVMVFFLGGCEMVDQITKLSGTNDSIPVAAPQRKTISQKEMAPDIKLACAAVLNGMRGQRDKINTVQFDPAGKHLLREKNFSYDGFDVIQTDIIGYTAYKDDSGAARAVLEGMFHFKDVFGRGTSAWFLAEYQVKGKKMTILRSAAGGVPPASPRVEAFFVPVAALDSPPAGGLKGFADFYAYVLEKSIPMKTSAREKQAQQAKSKLAINTPALTASVDQRYYLVVFCMDRIPDAAKLEVSVNGMEGSTSWNKAQSAYKSENGWRLTVIGGKFRCDAEAAGLWAHVLYTDPGTGQTTEIGRFSNRKSQS